MNPAKVVVIVFLLSCSLLSCYDLLMRLLGHSMSLNILYLVTRAILMSLDVFKSLRLDALVANPSTNYLHREPDLNSHLMIYILRKCDQDESILEKFLCGLFYFHRAPSEFQRISQISRVDAVTRLAGLSSSNSNDVHCFSGSSTNEPWYIFTCPTSQQMNSSLVQFTLTVYSLGSSCV